MTAPLVLGGVIPMRLQGFSRLPRRQAGRSVAGHQTEDGIGDLATVTDANSHATSFEYNADHQLTSVTDAADGQTTYSYDDAGHMTGRTNARSHAESYAYDRLGRAVTVTDLAGHTWQTNYDADGRVTSTVDGKGQTTVFAYDRANQLLSITPESGSAVNYSYDLAGQLTQLADGNGTTGYAYTAAGGLASTTRGGRTVGYSYDDAGRLDSVTYPGGGGTVTFTYDSAGRLQKTKDWSGRETTYSYDDASRLTHIAQPGNLSTDYTYDNINRPTAMDYKLGGDPLLSLGYGYDPVGNVTSYSDDSGAATFSYDELDRLVAAHYPGSVNYGYAYDAVGNTTSISSPAGTTNLSYNAADQIVSGSTAPTYDDNGAMTSDGSYGNRTFAYDALGRLTAVSGIGLSASYTYDGNGNRVGQTVNGTTTTFDLDLGAGLPTVLSDGTHKYLPGAPNLGFEQGGTWYSALRDLLGSPVQTVSQAGEASNPVRYDPYGGLRAGSAAPGSIGFTGQWTDATGLYNLRARAYDPLFGRFLQRDTFGGVASMPASGNRYAYALLNPLRFSDPSGRFVSQLQQNPGLAVSIAIGFVSAKATGLYLMASAIVGYDILTGQSLSPEWRLVYLGSGALIFLSSINFGPLVRDAEALAADSRLLELGGELGAAERGLARSAIGTGEGPGAALAGDALRVGERGSELGGLVENVAEEGGRFVYRGLTRGENISRGLVARSPEAVNDVLSHIAGLRDSQWISTTKSLSIAQEKFGQFGVVRIDLSKVTSDVVDVSRGIPGLPDSYMLSRWAQADQEVLIRGSVPPEAVQLLELGL
jgi:RHS repeat-associated protein